MSHSYKLVFIFFKFSSILANNDLGNIVGINNIVNIPNKIPAVPGFGVKGNDTGGTTTVMGTNYGGIIPGFAQNMFGVNKTGSDNSSANSNGNFGSFISGIPNKVFPNKTGNSGIPGYGIISGIPSMFGNNKTNSDNYTGIPDFGTIISGFPGQIFGNNKTNSGNGNKSNTDSGTGSNNGFPDLSSYIPGTMKKNKTFGSSSGSSNSGIPFIGNIPSFPNNIFGANKNDTSENPNLTGINIASITGIPEKVLGNTKENKTIEKRHCHGHNESEHEHDEPSERDKRQAASGLGSLGSLLPGASNLGSIGSALSGDSGDATLVLGMFQVLVKPIKTPSINQVTDMIKNPQTAVTDIMKNPQNILTNLTQPQTLLNTGGKR